MTERNRDHRCNYCKWWSEMLAQAVGGNPLEAVCLNPESALFGKYTHTGCDYKECGSPVDAPQTIIPEEKY